MERKTFSGVDAERLYWSPNGYYIVDPDGVTWECDFSGYRVTGLPEDAVELVPAAEVDA